MAKLTTKYGVEIPCDSLGRPMRDAPGKYDRSARAMGAPTEHVPRPASVIMWHNEDKPITLQGNSQVWTDQGAPLPYVLTYCPGTCKWTARFEGHTMLRRTPQDTLGVCQAADKDGIFETTRIV